MAIEQNSWIKGSVATGLVAFLGAVISLLLFHPGGMTNDTVVQYAQVKGIIPLDSWHPLVFVRAWSIMDVLLDGPVAMLVFHQAIFWLGLWLLVKNLFRSTVLQVLVLLILGFFPVIQTLMGTVWKDASLLSSGILGLGLLLQAKRKQSPWLYIPALLAFAYMSAVRHNGLLAALPMLWLMANSGSLLKTSIRTAGLTVIVLGLAFGMNHSSTVKKYPHLINQVLVWDLWGMSLELGQSLIPDAAFVNPYLNNLDHLKAHYNPYTNNSIIFEDEAGLDKRIFINDQVSDEIQTAFVQGVKANLGIYAGRRIKFFRRFLGFDQWKPYMAYSFEAVDPASLGLDKVTYHKMNESRLLTAYLKGLNYFIHFKGFNAIPYLLVLIIVLIVSLLRNNMFLLVLVISGFLYWLPHLVIAPSNDFRYHIWLVFVALLGALYLLFGNGRKDLIDG